MAMEELTSKMADQALVSPSPPSATLTAPAPAPAPPPKRTFEEALADLNKSPLFMTDLEENDDIAALQALSYEGTPLENGSDFKDRGNECFRQKRLADALEFYKKGIDILWLEERKRARRRVGEGQKKVEGRAEGDKDGKKGAEAEKDAKDAKDEKNGKDETEKEEDTPEVVEQQRAILAQLYTNRAACHLSLKNYRSCWLDCGAALRLDPTNLKALYRSARALLAVDRVAEAIDACDHGIAIDPAASSALVEVRAEAVARGAVLARKEAAEKERLEREARRAGLLKEALTARGIRTRTTPKPPDMEDAAVALVPDPDDAAQSALVFPTVLLYPAHHQSDFVKAFGETETLDDHLGYVLPLPWDEGREYAPDAVECFVETVGDSDAGRAPGLLKVGRKVALGKVLGTGKVEVVDELVKVFVLPKGKAAVWAEEYKRGLAKRAGLA